MENCNYRLNSNGTILYFEGCELVAADYDESGEEVTFSEEWFIDESGNRVDIEIKEDEKDPYDDEDVELYAYVIIEGQRLKTLNVFNYANGTVYLEPDD